jgi:hypothetical protein
MATREPNSTCERTPSRKGSSAGIPANIQCVHVKLNEADTLLIGNPQPAMNTNEVLESQLSSEAIRTTERLRRERCQMIDVLGPTSAEEGLQKRVGENAGRTLV